MVKKIVFPCIAGGGVTPMEFKIGLPAEGSHPISFQSKWLSSEKQGAVPPHIIKAISDLYKMAQETGANFEELCEMAFKNTEVMKNHTGS